MGNKEFYWSHLKFIQGSVSFFVDVECTVTISFTPPLNGLICVGRTVALTVAYTSDNGSVHKFLGYRWSIDGKPKMDANNCVHTNVEVISQQIINVTCEVFVKLNNNRLVLKENKSLYIQPNGKHHVHVIA